METLDFVIQNYKTFGLMFGLLCLSGFFSGSETALFSLKASDLNRIRKRPGVVSRAILDLHSDLREFLMTVLFCNMVVNILFFATSTVAASNYIQYLKDNGTPVSSASGASVLFGLIILLTVITFGEVTPKSIASAASPFFCRITALPMMGLHRGTWWVRHFLRILIQIAERNLKISEDNHDVRPEELKLLVEMSRGDGIISSEEHELIGGVLELHKIKLREIMTPRVEIKSIPSTATCEELLDSAKKHGHSKLPVRDPETDEYVGWVDARKVFVGKASGPITAYTNQPVFVSELDKADAVLSRFKDENIKIAIVVDERGAADGIITQTDLLAEVFGEIGDEDSSPETPVIQEGENCYLLAGDISVRKWRELFGVSHILPKTATIGGMVTAMLGTSPKKGDRVSIGNLQLEVIKTSRRKVLQIRLTLKPAEDE